VKAELQQLVALQNAETAIRKLQAELEAIPQRRAEIEKEFDQRAFEFKAVEARRDQAREKRAQLERDLAETRTRAEKAERDLMSSTNSKAYEAAIREADAAKKQISQLETQTLEQMEVIEQAEREMAEREPEVARLRAETDEKLKAFEERARAQAEELESRRAERERTLGTMPKNISSQYNRISTRIPGGVAVAAARNNSCSACSMKLRPQVMVEVRRGDDIIICENCNRILYYAPPEQQAQTQTAPSVSVS
jgi:predicted  nucleic acid-binding Zn-ribbon protein